MSDFSTVEQFEQKVAEFFGAPFGISVDSCTHGVELSLRLQKPKVIDCPIRTYLSIPMLSEKLNIKRIWHRWDWKDYYFLTLRVIDAAVLWKPDGYVPGTLMSISFQYQKHLSLGRGGMILCDNKEDALQLKKMSYDGRLPGIPWRQQDVDTIGYHYYMTPDTAAIGLSKLPAAIITEPRQWTVNDWPDLTQMKVFKQ